MPQDAVRLSDILKVYIPEHKPMECLGKKKTGDKEEIVVVPCTNQIARLKSDRARSILQHTMTFLDEENNIIEEYLRVLAILLIHGNFKHKDCHEQRANLQNKWRDLWQARVREHHERHRREVGQTVLDLHDQHESESDIECPVIEHESHEITHIPAVIHYPTLQAPTHEQAEAQSTLLSSQNARSVSFTRYSSSLIEGPPISSLTVVPSDNVKLKPAEVSLSAENLGLGVFMNDSQRSIFNYIMHTIWRICAIFQVQYGTVDSRNEIGEPAEQFVIQCKLLLGAKFPLPRFQDALHIIIPLTFALSQLMCVFLGPRLSFTLVFVVTLCGWSWSGARQKELQDVKTE